DRGEDVAGHLVEGPDDGPGRQARDDPQGDVRGPGVQPLPEDDGVHPPNLPSRSAGLGPSTTESVQSRARVTTTSSKCRCASSTPTCPPPRTPTRATPGPTCTSGTTSSSGRARGPSSRPRWQ